MAARISSRALPAVLYNCLFTCMGTHLLPQIDRLFSIIDFLGVFVGGLGGAIIRRC